MIPSAILSFSSPLDLESIDRMIDGIFGAQGASAHAVIGNGDWYTTHGRTGLRCAVEPGTRVFFGRDDGITTLNVGGTQVYPLPGATLQVRIYQKGN